MQIREIDRDVIGATALDDRLELVERRADRCRRRKLAARIVQYFATTVQARQS